MLFPALYMLFLDWIMLIFLSFPIYIQIPFIQCLLKGLIQEYSPAPQILKLSQTHQGNFMKLIYKIDLYLEEKFGNPRENSKIQKQSQLWQKI